MGARWHGQGGHLPPSHWKCCKVFCALVVTDGKRSVDDFFCIIFTTCRRLLWASPQTLTGALSLSLNRAGGLSSGPRPLICRPLEKNPAGSHDIEIEDFGPADVKKTLVVHNKTFILCFRSVVKLLSLWCNSEVRIVYF